MAPTQDSFRFWKGTELKIEVVKRNDRTCEPAVSGDRKQRRPVLLSGSFLRKKPPCLFATLKDQDLNPVKPDDNIKEILGLNPLKFGTTHQQLPQEEGEDSNNVLKLVIELDDARRVANKFGFLVNVSARLTAVSITGSTYRVSSEVTDHECENQLDDPKHNFEEAERFNKLSLKDKQRYICEVFKQDDEVGDGRVIYFVGTSGSSTENLNYEPGETSGSSTENTNYGRSEVRGHPDQNHICTVKKLNCEPLALNLVQNHFVVDDEGKYEGLTEAMQKSFSEAIQKSISEAMQKSFEAGLKQNIDNKNVNDEHVIDMPVGPDHNNKKEQANDGDGPFRLCEIGLANTVSLMGSNPPPWATTHASQTLLGFSGAANVVGYMGTTAALSLRYTKPGVARIFANVGPISCAWGVIMGFTSYLPGELQWMGYVAAMFCSLMIVSYHILLLKNQKFFNKLVLNIYANILQRGQSLRWAIQTTIPFSLNAQQSQLPKRS
ncbi:hypothetical protein LguiB_013105 [Lonicera macranthoides]